MNLDENNILGGGKFGKVYLYDDEKYGNVAIKKIKKNKINQSFQYNEIDIIKKLNHPNIVHFYYMKEDENFIYIAMEYIAKGELYDYIFSIIEHQEIVYFYFKQIVAAFEYLHSLNIAHRDIKFENLLMNDDYQIKICDFGLATYNKQMTDICGSPLYLAPEIYINTQYDPFKADIWSLGIMLFILLTGETPIEQAAKPSDNIYQLILDKKYDIFPWTTIESPYAKDLCINMLNPEPLKRFTIEQIKNHPWFYGVEHIGLEHIPLSYISQIICKQDYTHNDNIDVITYGVANYENDKYNNKVVRNYKLLIENQTINSLCTLIEYVINDLYSKFNLKYRINENKIILYNDNKTIKICIMLKSIEGNIFAEFIRLRGSMITFNMLFNKLKHCI